MFKKIKTKFFLIIHFIYNIITNIKYLKNSKFYSLINLLVKIVYLIKFILLYL
jgi:hypothetical protein